MTKNINNENSLADTLYLSSLDIMDGQLADYNMQAPVPTSSGRVRKRRQVGCSDTPPNENRLYFKPESKTVRYLLATGLVAYGAGIFYLMLRDQNHSKDIIFKTS